MRVFVVCNGALLSEVGVKPNADAQLLEATRKPPRSNLRLELKNITHRILSNLNPVASDLVEIASFVYWADSSVRRGTPKEVFGSRWKRDFTFVLPVREVEIWQSQAVQEALVETLSYLTGDHYTFHFVQSAGLPEQLIFKDLRETAPWCPDADIVSLFSGGLDSLAGAIYLQRNARRPILVSHRSMPGIDSRQKLLVQHLKERIPNWEFPHLSVWVHRQREDAVEHTQRSRGFLYLALAATVGQELNIYDIAICENGIVTFNLPRGGQTPGTLRSRSTDPRFLSTFSRLVSLVFGHKFDIFNPFLFLTRTEVVKTLVQAGYGDLAPASVSCTRTRRGFAKLHPHCGTCYQCVDRRFAVAAAGVETADELNSFAKDLFIDSLSEGDERTSAENTVRFARALRSKSPDDFLTDFPDLFDYLYSIPGDTDEIARRVYELHQRFGIEVYSVIQAKLSQYSDDLIDGSLPDSCLLSMVGRQEHVAQPIEVYARKIADLCREAIRIDFQSRKPSSEREVQDAIEGALVAAGERLDRESPMLSYTVVKTKPDFSSTGHALFVEVKFISKKGRLNRINTEITSRITIYRDQGAHALFLVYDGGNFIADEKKFLDQLEEHPGIYAVVLRS